MNDLENIGDAEQRVDVIWWKYSKPREVKNFDMLEYAVFEGGWVDGEGVEYQIGAEVSLDVFLKLC